MIDVGHTTEISKSGIAVVSMLHGCARQRHTIGSSAIADFIVQSVSMNVCEFHSFREFLYMVEFVLFVLFKALQTI